MKYKRMTIKLTSFLMNELDLVSKTLNISKNKAILILCQNLINDYEIKKKR